jgi:4-hydroxy-2-oxoheptanedioate aldolase
MFDYVEFVGEYGPYDLHDLDNIVRACELYDMSSMIKVDQANNAYVAQRSIGSGFQSVLFTDTRTVEEARECVRIARPDTPEAGGRFGAVTRRFTYMGYGGDQDYLDALNDIVVVLMIEKGPAVENLEEILSVGGIDMIQWGPADYSMSIGRIGQGQSPEIKEIEKKVLAKSIEMGIPPRAEINSADDAKYYLDLGVRHFCIGTDINIIFNYMKNEGGALRKALEG